MIPALILWAIVPVKPFAEGKARLAASISDGTRARLNRDFLHHTLTVLAEFPGIARTIVVSRDPDALAMAEEMGARPLLETGEAALNPALGQATGEDKRLRAEAVLVVPTDLPLASAGDFETLVREAGPPPTIVIAPDRTGTGTNALYAAPPGLIRYFFGTASAAAHAEAAQQAGAAFHSVSVPGLAFDIDTEADYAKFQGLGKAGALADGQR